MELTLKKIIHGLKTRGLKGSIERYKNGKPEVDIVSFWGFITDLEEIKLSKNDYLTNKDEKITLNWIVPEMGIGSGGHINIFRFISYLEKHGIHNRVYLYRAISFPDNNTVRQFVRKYFSILDHNVDVFCDVKYIEFAHGTIATGWDTAYFVRRFNNTISKFYFIQDYEPYFFAQGSEYSFAENTYKFGFRGITAGDWLKDICINKFGMQADSFGFSYDKDLYKPTKKADSKKRVFFYARPVTPRRDFELGILALNELAKRVPDLEVVFAGWDVSQYKIDFNHVNMGILDISELSELYASCDMCLVISNTNLSLLPLEVMASGSVAVCSKGANSEWLINEENSILVDFDPIEIAKTMQKYLENPNELEKIRQKGVEFAQSTSWDDEGEKVRQAILKGIQEDEKDIDNRW